MDIAYKTTGSANVGPGNATVTKSVTATVTNGVIFIGIHIQNLGGISSIKCNGVDISANLIDSIGTASKTYLYYANVTSGTITIEVVRNTTTGYMMLLQNVYEQVNQAMTWSGGGATDAKTKASGTGVSTFTGTLTTIQDKSWCILMAEFDNASISAGSGSTERTSQIPGYKAWGLYDTNSAKTPAGSKSMTITGGYGGYQYVMASFSPASGGGGDPVSNNAIFPLLCRK